MRVLVTGGTGFIGSNLALELLRLGHEVFVTGKTGERPVAGATNLGPEFWNLDWKKIGKPDAVFHEAAIADTTVTDRALMLKINFENAQKLFREAAAAGCPGIVYASSTAVYGNGPVPYKENQKPDPLNPYAESKMLLDEWAAKFAGESPNVAVTGLRYCNVYGPGESRKGRMATMIYQLARQMKGGNPRVFKWGEQKRDYIYVKDVVRANLLAAFGRPRPTGRAAQAKEGGIYNCGFGKATSFNEIIRILNGVLGLNREPEYFDNPYEGKYQNYTECDISLAKEKLGFVPEFDVEKGIRDYYASGFLTSP